MGVTRVSNTPDPSGKPRLERALTDSSKGRPTGTLRRPNSHALVVRKNAEPEGSSVRSVSAPIIYMREHVIASSGAEDVPQRSPSPKTPPAQSPQNSQFGTAPNKDATLVMPRKMPSSPPRPSTFFNNPVLLTSRSAFSSKRLEFSPPDAARKKAKTKQNNCN